MKKFTFFLFLFFPLLCFAQKNFAKTAVKNSPVSAPQQINTGRPANIQMQKPAQRETPKTPNVSNNIAFKEQKRNFQTEKTIPLNKVQAQKENKPTPTKPALPPARPGNYKVVYWTDFIDTQTPKEKDWAIKLLDTKKLSLDGRGVQVAVLDSGIKNHPQFNGANIEVLDITGQDNPVDFCGHGTAVAGIIVGKRANDFSGLAPAVSLKSYKIADESGTTNNNYIISALNSILDYNRQHPNNKISIVNISYGLAQDNFELKNKLAEVYSSGVSIISAGGNDGVQGLLFPAAYDFVFAAGSIDKDKTVSDFSNWGQNLDFVLPGSGLMTLGLNNDYVWVKGTSFSSAYLTGIAALATQAFKNKYGRLPSPQELYEVLQKISTPVRNTPSVKQGYGLPDASKIVSYI